MEQKDFTEYKIKNFSVAEIEATGAKLEDVHVMLILWLQYFRDALNKENKKNDIKIRLLKNGLTTGKHKCKEHKNGRAVDFTIDWGKNDELDIQEIIGHMITHAFGGVGIYDNFETFARSYHLDMRSEFKFWYGYKVYTKAERKYIKLLTHMLDLL